jgi:histone acetyltransferase (RNA polymerase elongator complex component)
VKNARKPKTTPVAHPRPLMTRTVKIADVLHHRIRVLSVQRRMPMQELIEGLLTAGLKDKVYDKFADADAGRTVPA